jgi:hypothetical protein
VQWLEGEIDGLHAYLRGLGSTPEGRVELRQRGFTTSDKEADKAHSEAEARDRAEEFLSMLRKMPDARYAEADRMDAVLAELLAPLSEAEQFEQEMK